MSDTPDPSPADPDDIAPLLRIGLDDAVDADATILVTAPTPRTGSSTAGGARGWQPPTLEELQHMLPQYEISAFIARGGMGALYKGMQKTLKRPVAIKVLPPDLEDGDLQFAARFKHEAQAMAQLSHPNIVAVFDAGETPDGLLYFVMEYIEGTDVAQLIASEGIIEPRRAIQITTAVCEALAFAHEEGIIHRDIKPSNIMLDKKGRVKVADFGLAKTVNQEHSLLTGSNVAMGTPDFIAPEAMIPGIKVDQRADIYAVGVMLYQMLTGHIPRGRFELPSGVVPQVDKAFDAVVDKAMQTDREKRYSTALEMKKDVESVVIAKEGGAGTHARPHSIGIAATKKKAPKSGRGPLLIAAAVVVLGGAGVWFVLRDSSRQGQWAQVTLPAEAGLQASSGGLSRSASLPVSNSPAFPPGHWRDAMKEGLLKEMIKQAGPTDKGYLLPSGQHWRFPVEPLKAGAIRIRTTVGDSPLPELCFYLGDERTAHYRARISKDLKSCALRYAPGPEEVEQVLTTAPIELKPGQAHEWMLVSTGSHLWVTLDGKVILNAPKADAGAGRLALVTPNDAKNIRLLKAEYVSLDGLSEAEALKAAGIDPVSTSPGLPVPASNASRSDAGGAKSSAAFPPGQWTKVLTTAQEVKANSGGTKTLTMREDGWIDSMGGEPGILIVPGPYRRNQGLRLRGRVQEGGPKILGGISVRRSGLTQGVRERYHTTVNMDGEVVTYYSTEGKVSQERLQSFRAASAFPPGTEYVLEVIAIGDKLHTRINGDALPVLTDNRLESGQLAVQTTKGHLIRDVEVIYFDGLSDDEARKAAGVASSPPNAPNSSATTSPAVKAGQWIDATAEVKQNGLERNLLKVEGDWLIAKRGINYFPVSGTLELADAAVRVVFRGRVQMKLRQQPLSEKLAGYIASIGSGKSVGIGFTGPTTEKEWLKPDADLGQAYQPDEEHELVFAVHGNQLIYGMDGRLIARVEDARFQKGKIELATLMDQANNPNPTRIKKVEYMSLDGLSEAEARKAAGIPSSPGPRVSPSPNWNRVVFPTTFATDEIRNKGGSGMVGDLLGVWKDAIFTGDTKQLLRNAAVRITAPAAQPKWPVKLVSRLSKGQYTLRVWGRNVDVVRYDQGDQELKTFLLAQPLNEGGDFTAQFASIGSEHFVWINGQLLGSVTDDAHGEPGLLGVQAGDGRFKSMETLSLDGLSEAEARKVAGIDPVSPSPTLPVPASNASRSDAGGSKSSATAPLPQPGPDGRMVFPVGVWTQMKDLAKHEKTEDGPWVRLGEPAYGWFEKDIVPMTNLGIRARFRGQRVKDYDYPQLNLRGVENTALNLHIRSGKMHIRVTEEGFPVLAEAPLREPLPQGKEYVAELYAIGRQVIARVNGQVLTATTDVLPAPGRFDLFGADRDSFQDAQVLNLDGLSEAEARKAAGIGE